MRATMWIGVVLGVLLAPGPPTHADAPPVRFEIESDFGDESAWVAGYLDQAARTLVALMDNGAVAPPASIRVKLTKDPNAGGVGGYAGPDRIGFTSTVWPKEKFREWILAHELTNLFAHHYGGAGGYPSDWWANGRSPFPLYVACLVMEKTGHGEAAAWFKQNSLSKPDHALYWKLHDAHGFGLFARFFQLVRKDGIDMGRIGAPWPHPDRRRTAYTIAYLSKAAGENLAPICRAHGVGNEPDDWRRIHPKIPFQTYEVTETDVERTLEARAWLFEGAEQAGYFEALREAFRLGGALDAAAPARVAFDVQSQFAPESDWVAGFCETMAGRAIEAIGQHGLPHAARIAVRLRRMESLAGVGGGLEDGQLSYVSNVWPKENFRLWILTRDVVRFVVQHRSGTALPADWWKADLSAFTDTLAADLLDAAGHRGTATWLRSMTGKDRTYALHRTLLKEHGPGLYARAFTLLREDGIDLLEVDAGSEPSALRSAYAAAYLSIAAGSNLAPLLRAHGVGAAPAHQAKGAAFASYTLSDASVAQVMERREALFESEASDAARAAFRTGR